MDMTLNSTICKAWEKALTPEFALYYVIHYQQRELWNKRAAFRSIKPSFCPRDTWAHLVLFKTSFGASPILCSSVLFLWNPGMFGIMVCQEQSGIGCSDVPCMKGGEGGGSRRATTGQSPKWNSARTDGRARERERRLAPALMWTNACGGLQSLRMRKQTDMLAIIGGIWHQNIWLWPLTMCIYTVHLHVH